METVSPIRAEPSQRYREHSSQFLRTDEAGAVTVVSDGQSFRIETVFP
jgi:beta-lactamase superfamily II metal-dependent hydrolase